MLQAAAQELLIRRRGRSSLLGYSQAIAIPGKPLSEDPDEDFFQPIETRVALHHRLLLEALDRTANTRHGRLMVFMPRGAAKTTYASVVFPSYHLGKHPGHRLILTSYGDEPARRMGRRTRAILRQERFRHLFEAQLSGDSTAAQDFSLTNGSEYIAASIFAGVTGLRANGIIFDDPVKGRKEADSETTRASTFEAYQDDLLPCLIPGGWVVLVMTRWHEDDLAGRILPTGWKGESGVFDCKDGMQWTVLCIQAKCETETDPLGRQIGDYLWPEWFDRKHWSQFEGSPRTWNSMFQQRPAPLEGALFKPDKISVVAAVPIGTRFVRGWDLAATQDDGAYTAGVKFGVMPDGRWIIADVRRLQGSPDLVEAAIVNAARADGASVKVGLPQDPGQAGKAQVAYLTRQLAGFTVESSPESGDKETRAEPVAAQVNVGNVCMLRADWNDPLISEMRMFPNGTYKDQVDALSRAFHTLTGTGAWFFASI